MFFYYRQKLLPRVINSRCFFRLLLCCWHDKWYRHQHTARLQEHGHGLQGKEGNGRAHKQVVRLAEAYRGHWPAVTRQFTSLEGSLWSQQTAPSPAQHQHHGGSPSHCALRETPEAVRGQVTWPSSTWPVPCQHCSSQSPAARIK